MRIGLLSDVHANLPALEEVLRDLRGRGVDVLLHAGDVVGYNPFPNEVIEVFQREEIRTILGNHDRAVLTGDNYWFNSVAATALRWTRACLESSSVSYLRSLKPRMELEIGGSKLLVVHGSPEDADEYIYEGDLREDILPPGFDALVMGHTHVPFVRRLAGALVVNPGSVGQPRDGDPRASYALLDVGQGHGELRRVEYDARRVVRAIEAASLPQFLGVRLLEGR